MRAASILGPPAMPTGLSQRLHCACLSLSKAGRFIFHPLTPFWLSLACRHIYVFKLICWDITQAYSGCNDFLFLWVNLSLSLWKPKNGYSNLCSGCAGPLTIPASSGLFVLCWCRHSCGHLGTVFPCIFTS